VFCPLCKYEYRSGFTQCSDCRIPLLASQAEAQAVQVELLWSGENRTKLDSILEALTKANVPLLLKEGVTCNPWRWQSVFFFLFGSAGLRFEFEVRVLAKDFVRARQAILLGQEEDFRTSA
jgi:hypothetical protein